MGIYERWILPHVIDAACGMKLVGEQRRQVVTRAHGVVLEPGIGGGLNFDFYDPAAVTKVIGIEPSIELGNRARERARGRSFEVELHSAGAELDIVEPQSVDTVLFTYTLCTVPDPGAVLAAMRRALKPGGRLLFLEHARAPDDAVRAWQHRIEPVWKVLAGGCHLTRSASAELRRAGFDVSELETRYVAQAPRWVGFHEYGAAQPS
jgi:SAM-dependent methyltransferase